jgi:hypothetical protein
MGKAEKQVQLRVCFGKSITAHTPGKMGRVSPAGKDSQV